MSNDDDQLWDDIRPVASDANEATVEHAVVGPLLAALGYAPRDIAPKVRVTFVHGVKRGRPFEADYVVYSGPIQDQDTSLMVIEAKGPDRDNDSAREQAESYAQVLKTPLMLLTNGVNLQLWQFQPALKSQLVFECAVADVKSRRAELEQLASRNAVLEYAKSIAYKKVTPTPEFREFEAAELQRTAASHMAVGRTLSRGREDKLGSAHLLAEFPRGAIISGPSGYGKTVLCESLTRLAIKRRWSESAQAVVASVCLQDFAAGDICLLDYVLKRMQARQPGLAKSALEKAIRESGAVLTCDAYERVPAARRAWVNAQLREFHRDYLHGQLFIFTRPSVLPEIELENLRLLALDGDQQREMASAGPSYMLAGAPRLLLDLTTVPLLLRLVIDYKKDRGKFPSQLEELFEQWLSRLLQGAGGGAVAAARRRQVIDVIAAKLHGQALSLRDAVAAVSAIPIGDAALDELVDAGVLVVENDRIEPVHEGLADYVRARALAQLTPTELKASLAASHFDEDSLLPVLVVSLADGAQAKGAAWESLKTISARRYIDAVRFGERVLDPPTCQPTPEQVHEFLSDMLGGLKGFTSAFTPRLTSAINTSSVGALDPVPELRLLGNIAVDGQAQLTYAYRRLEQGERQIEVRWPDFESGGYRYMSLSLLGLGTGSGRYLGIIQARDSILDIIRRRAFEGGVQLANERTIRRLQFLRREYHYAVSSDETVQELIERFEPMVDRVAIGHFGAQDLSFAIASLLADLKALHAAGRQKIDWWWLPFGSTNEEICGAQGTTEAFLKEHYSRAVALYREVVETSFAPLARELPLYRAMPLRWELWVVPGQRAFGGPTAYWRWLPVGTEREAQIACNFADHPRADFMSFEPHATNLRLELQRLGRDLGRFSLGGFRRVPSVDSTEFSGRFTGDTSVLREVASWLASDINAVFEDLRQERLTLGDIPVLLEP